MNSQTENSTLKENVEQDMKAAGEEIAGAAKLQAEAGKDQAADKLGDLSEAIDQIADKISENDKLGLASYVRSASSQLAAFAGHLQERSMDELAEDAKELARRRPTAFMLGSVVVGFGLSRFIKASSHHTTSANRRNEAQQNFQPAADFSGATTSH